jgi:hypothetical protein
VRLVLERQREQAARPPVLALALPEHVTRRDAPMRMQSLAAYDRRYDRAKDRPDKHPENHPDNHPPESSDDD